MNEFWTYNLNNILLFELFDLWFEYGIVMDEETRSGIYGYGSVQLENYES